MDPLSGVASVIAVVQLTQDVVSALLDFYQTAREAREEVKYLARTLESLETVLKHAVQKDSFKSSSGILGSLKSELSDLLEKLGPLEAAGKSKHVFKSLKMSLVWPFKKGDVEKRTKKIESQKTALLVELGISNFDISFDNSNLLTQLAEKIRKAQHDEHRRSVVSWLSNAIPDTSLYHVAARTRHEETTGEWLTSSDELQLWMNGSNSFLWLKGGAGAGKTILCSTVIEYLQNYCKYHDIDSFSAVVYWYFSFADQQTQNTYNFLSSLVRDLCSRTLHLPDAVLDSYSLHNNGQQRPATKNLLQMFQSLAPGFDHVYLVVDALDECPQNESQLCPRPSEQIGMTF